MLDNNTIISEKIRKTSGAKLEINILTTNNDAINDTPFINTAKLIICATKNYGVAPLIR